MLLKEREKSILPTVQSSVVVVCITLIKVSVKMALHMLVVIEQDQLLFLLLMVFVALVISAKKSTRMNVGSFSQIKDNKNPVTLSKWRVFLRQKKRLRINHEKLTVSAVVFINLIDEMPLSAKPELLAPPL